MRAPRHVVHKLVHKLLRDFPQPKLFAPAVFSERSTTLGHSHHRHHHPHSLPTGDALFTRCAAHRPALSTGLRCPQACAAPCRPGGGGVVGVQIALGPDSAAWAWQCGRGTESFWVI